VSDPDSKPRGFDSLPFRIAIYIACWLVALFATNPNATLLPLVYLFPLGLAAFFFPHYAQGGGWDVMVGGILFYVVQAVAYFRARTRRLRLAMLVVLVLALVCNVAGCRRILNSH
jgi:uncharacterized membrane protein